MKAQRFARLDLNWKICGEININRMSPWSFIMKVVDKLMRTQHENLTLQLTLINSP